MNSIPIPPLLETAAPLSYKHGQRIIIEPRIALEYTEQNSVIEVATSTTAHTTVDVKNVKRTPNTLQNGIPTEFLDDKWSTEFPLLYALQNTAHITLVTIRPSKARDTVLLPVTIRGNGNTVLFIHALENAKANIVLTLDAARTLELIRVIALAGANITITHEEGGVHSHAKLHYLSYRQTRQYSHSEVSWQGIPIVMDYARIQYHNELCGADAIARQSCRTHAHDEARYDITLSSTHHAPRTTSILDGRIVASERSQSLLRGTIMIAQNAASSTGIQNLRLLTLGQYAEADAIPKLDIHNHDTTCKHSAFVKGIDEDELFYLEQRGITRDDAQTLIINGFLGENT